MTSADCIPAPTKYRNKGGYAKIKRDGKWYRAHRYAWMQVNGAIPDGLQVLHRCDNPECINVEHLFLGTRSDNMNDMWTKGRHGPGGRRKLTWDQVQAIRSSSEPQQVLADRYGVHQATISNIKTGRTRNKA